MDKDLTQVLDGIAELRRNEIRHFPISNFEEELDLGFTQLESVVLYSKTNRVRQPDGNYVAEPQHRLRISPEKRPPPWHVGMSHAFKKDIENIDMKVRGRILAAVSDLTDDPIRPRGDTVKPFAGELEGCWRYRVGDYRLVYVPDKGAGDITLLAFAARGSIYE